MKKIVIDLDGTITFDSPSAYSDKPINKDVLQTLRDYKSKGFAICIYTARNMRTYQGNVGQINVHTLPGIIDWLDKHQVPYDEIIVGKPWCGFEGFYVDDKAIRPSEFVSKSFDEIQELLAKENPYKDGGNK